MRIKHPALRGSHDLARRMEALLSAVPGIRAVSTSSITAAVLIEYDAAMWRDAAGTRLLWAALCSLFPENCFPSGFTLCACELQKYPSLRQSVIDAFQSAPGVTDLSYDGNAGVLSIKIDAQQFALEPVLRTLTQQVARAV
jgi:hypothetical protein